MPEPSDSTGGVVKNVFKLRLSIAGGCNYTCFFCHNEGRTAFSKRRMTPQDVLLLCDAAWLAGIKSFTFTGGEPLTHPEVFDFIRTVRQRFPDATLKLTTNASLLRIDHVSFLTDHVDRIRINFQSVRRDRFHRLTGYDGLPQLLDIIDAIRQTRTHICLNYVYNSRSKDELPGIVDFATAHHIEMKVLELIKNAHNAQFHESIATARSFLESVSVARRKDYQNDDLYFIRADTPKIRLCYSHCNSCDARSCRILGELRTSPELDIYPCMSPMTPKVRVSERRDPEHVAKLILYADSLKGLCPKPAST